MTQSDHRRIGVSFPREEFEQALHLIQGSGVIAVRFQAGVSETLDWVQVLATAPVALRSAEEDLDGPSIVLSVEGGSRPVGIVSHETLRWWTERAKGQKPVGIVAVDQGTPQHRISGLVDLSEGGTRAVDSVTLVGSGCRTLFTPAGARRLTATEVSDRDRLRWSRCAAALGEGEANRLRSLLVTINGAGRTGSLIAHHLARLGIRTTLVDDDVVELHNLDGDGLTRRDVGRHKAAVLAEFLGAFVSERVRPRVVGSKLDTLDGIAANKRADLVVTAVDNDPARLAAGIPSLLYLKPQVVVGTGILRTRDRREMGADIRIILPDRCVLCFGGFEDPERTRAALVEGAEPGALPWHLARSGSLRSLNTVASGVAVRLFEDLVSERIEGSRWIRVEFDERGAMSAREIIPEPRPDCPLCSLRGQGDAGLAAARTLLSRPGALGRAR